MHTTSDITLDNLVDDKVSRLAMIKSFFKSTVSLFYIILDLIANVVRALLAVFLVFITFVPVSAFMGIRYCCRRRRHPEQFTAAAQAAANRSRYRTRTRKRKPKLMTMEQVNEKFPTMTFKQAKIERPASSNNSIEIASLHDTSSTSDMGSEHNKAVGEITEVVSSSVVSPEVSEDGTTPKTEDDSQQAITAVVASPNEQTEELKDHKAFERAPEVEAQSEPAVVNDDTIHELHSEDDEDEEEEEEVQALEDVSNDTCAICIENMEDDEVVRLLTCGHIFHSECIDPWLTVRRACCPLCKADYYVKPPPAPAADAAGEVEGEGIELARRATQTQASDSAATRRRRAQAIYNIFGRRHNRPSRRQTPTPPEPAVVRPTEEAVDSTTTPGVPANVHITASA